MVFGLAQLSKLFLKFSALCQGPGYRGDRARPCPRSLHRATARRSLLDQPGSRKTCNPLLPPSILGINSGGSEAF